MPIYEYHCDACETRFERLHRITSSVESTDEPIVCPGCGGTSVHKVISAFMVSSEGVRQTNLRTARRANQKVAREKQQADIDYLKSHEH